MNPNKFLLGQWYQVYRRFVLVNKHSYGLKFPGYYFPITKTIEPRRGDVAVFMPPHTLCEVDPRCQTDLADISISDSQFFKFKALKKNVVANLA